jgi:chromosome segregation ATPase
MMKPTPTLSTLEALRQQLAALPSDAERIKVLLGQINDLDKATRNYKKEVEEKSEKIKAYELQSRSKDDEIASLQFNYERVRKRLHVLQEEAKERVDCTQKGSWQEYFQRNSWAWLFER